MDENINNWIEENNGKYRLMRQAVHVILKSISIDESLNELMIMKGGTLLGVKHGSDRYTKDIDFSTEKTLKDIDLEALFSVFNDSMDVAEAELGYGLKCKVQSYRIQPHPQGTFPTVQIKVAYCERSNDSAMRRLEANQSPSVISIDFSFNEKTYNFDFLSLDGDRDGDMVKTYSIIDLVAEKYRSILQQKERGRNREQDVYDINYLLSKYEFSKQDRYEILNAILEKSKGKNIDDLLNQQGLRDRDIIERSGKGYSELSSTVRDLPPFDMSYENIAVFYESLPWDIFK
ncbi:nucleotidyl transferase AbiEii/AbiGii toxin family protein [Salmonella enterica]|uniref:nucleotidyl transferase AbiEii/AbiGii toxin family protein n=1 Tax=Salmonella enterica TaxID=28901 RepID=UPI0009AD2186|nr:nucleotidyl transferase AbiEii/AbiGii toxin family protein [Salmonella enterica]